MVDVAEVRDTWDSVADGWDEHADRIGDFTAPIRRRIIDVLRPGPDDRVLELAGGTGHLSCAIAPAVRRVTCTDLSPRMVAAARRRAEREGLTNVAFDVVDAHTLPYDDGSVDGIVCQQGFMLMPDPVAALGECRRVLGSDGRLVFSTWGPGERNPWLVVLGAALLQHGHLVDGDPHAPGGVFSLSEPDTLAAVVADAGFGEVETEAVEVTDVYASFDEYWDFHRRTAGPIAVAFSTMGEAEVAEVRATCESFCASFETTDGYRFPGQALVTVAEPQAT